LDPTLQPNTRFHYAAVSLVLGCCFAVLGRADGEDVRVPELAQLGHELDGIHQADHRQFALLHVDGDQVEACAIRLPLSEAELRSYSGLLVQNKQEIKQRSEIPSIFF